MLKNIFFISVCSGLLAAPSVGAITQTFYYEYKGFEYAGGTFIESEGGNLTMPLTKRPTGWKVGSVYRARNDIAVEWYFGSEYQLKEGVEGGFIKDATDKATISETAVTCPVDTAYPIPVIRYEPYQYTIAFNANASPVSGSMAAQSGLSYTNTTTTLQPNAFTRTGYVFAGWTTAPGSETVFADQTTVGGEKFGVTADGQTVTLYAKWRAKSYTVAYDEAGGTAGSSRPTAAAYDAAFLVSAPTRTGYTFLGWTVSGYDANTAAWGTTSSSVASTLPSDGQITASGDIWLKSLTPTAGATVTLTARWKVITCQVTFSPEGGRNGATSLGIDYGQTTDGFATIQPPERANYTFQGYYTEQKGKGTCYFDADGRLLRTWDIAAGTCTLYAHWTETSYIVTFDPNGGSGTVADLNVTYTETFVLPSGSDLTPPSEGHSFGGWALSAHASDAAYQAEQEACLSDLSSQLSGGKLTFYAYWRDNTRTIRVNANGGTASSNSFTVVIGKHYDARGPLPTATWADGKKLFAGWYTAASDGSRVQASDTVPQDVPSTLYAHWTNATYTVHFDGNGSTGGSTMAYQTIFFDTPTALTPNAFVRTGYTFAGWAKTNTPTCVFEDGATVKDLATRAGDVVTLLAVWTTNTYYVAFDANGGEGTMPPLTNLYDQAFTLPTNRFTHSNKFMVFSKWRDVATGKPYAEGAEARNLTNAPFATVTLQAVWTNSLSALSQAMHCDNLDWQNDSLGGRTNPWLPHESGNGSGVGHGTDSCVWQKNGVLAKQQFLWTKLEQTDRAGIKGRLSFWCKATNPGVTLMYGCSKNPRTVSNSISVPESDWLEVVVPISDTAAELYVSLLNATTSGEGYCCIDGMTWTPDGENPTPGESDRVEAASLTRTANGLELSFTGDARFAYHLRATDSLSPTNWYDFGSTIEGTGAAQTFVIPFDAAAPQRFFKIETIQRPTP